MGFVLMYRNQGKVGTIGYCVVKCAWENPLTWYSMYAAWCGLEVSVLEVSAVNCVLFCALIIAVLSTTVRRDPRNVKDQGEV